MKAATVFLYQSEGAETAVGGVEQKYAFTLTQKTTLNMVLIPGQMFSKLTITLYDSTGAAVDAESNPNEMTSYDDPNFWYIDSDGYPRFFDEWTLEAGDYSYGVTFAEDNEYLLAIGYAKPDPVISDKQVTLTAGFTRKISVTNGKVTKWSSNKAGVASVDQKGKITAKKKGKAKITAKLADGTKLTCTVTVQPNKYSKTKLTNSQVPYDKYAADAYSAEFDKNGNLVVKVAVVNGGYGTIIKIPGFKVTVTDQNGKTVGTYKASSLSVNVTSYSSKTYSFTIKKSAKLTPKKVDLRNSSIKVDGGTATTRR